MVELLSYTGASGTLAPVVHRHQWYTGASVSQVPVVHMYEWYMVTSSGRSSRPRQTLFPLALDLISAPVSILCICFSRYAEC